MFKKFGREVKRIGKQAEAFVKEASLDIKEAVDSTVVEIATSGQLKQAKDRANNVNERLETLRGQLAPVQDQARDSLLNETVAATLDKAAIQERIKKMRILLKALETQSTAVAAWIVKIENKAEDGTSSKTGARNECEAFLGNQQADEKTFAALEKQLQEMIATQLADLQPQQVMEEDDDEEEEHPLILLIQQRATFKATWDRMLNDPFFPSNISKDNARAKIAELSDMLDKLIAGDESVSIDVVKAEFNKEQTMRTTLEAGLAKRSTSGVMAFSDAAAASNKGSGVLQVETQSQILGTVEIRLPITPQLGFTA